MSTLLQAPAKPVKKHKITWDTNYNNKLQCQAFIHIDLAPTTIPQRDKVEGITIEIATADGSHPTIKAQLLDMLFFKISQCPNAYTLPSHGLTNTDFCHYILNKHKNLSFNSQLAVYYYQKIN